jgi:hypothetical protein
MHAAINRRRASASNHSFWRLCQPRGEVWKRCSLRCFTTRSRFSLDSIPFQKIFGEFCFSQKADHNPRISTETEPDQPGGLPLIDDADMAPGQVAIQNRCRLSFPDYSSCNSERDLRRRCAISCNWRLTSSLNDFLGGGASNESISSAGVVDN